ncbi:MAG: hypothetical protein ACLVFA_03610 [Butyricicoccus sp.]
MTVKVAPFSVIPDSADTKIATSSMKLNKFASDKQQKSTAHFFRKWAVVFASVVLAHLNPPAIRNTAAFFPYHG